MKYHALFAFMLLSVPLAAGAQGFENPIEFNTISEFLVAMLDVVVRIAFPFIVLAIIYTGFLFVTARGNQDKLKEAKTTFLLVIIGSLLILGASVLARAIESTVHELQSGVGTSELADSGDWNSSNTHV